jgi:hypothetical protein
MTIEEYKAKLDAYLGMTGELKPDDQDKDWADRYIIKYNAPSGVPIAIYRVIRSKIHKMPHGWYESGSRTALLPRLDPDDEANYNWYHV